MCSSATLMTSLQLLRESCDWCTWCTPKLSYLIVGYQIAPAPVNEKATFPPRPTSDQTAQNHFLRALGHESRGDIQIHPDLLHQRWRTRVTRLPRYVTLLPHSRPIYHWAHPYCNLVWLSLTVFCWNCRSLQEHTAHRLTQHFSRRSS